MQPYKLIVRRCEESEKQPGGQLYICFDSKLADPGSHKGGGGGKVSITFRSYCQMPGSYQLGNQISQHVRQSLMPGLTQSSNPGSLRIHPLTLSVRPSIVYLSAYLPVGLLFPFTFSTLLYPVPLLTTRCQPTPFTSAHLALIVDTIPVRERRKTTTPQEDTNDPLMGHAPHRHIYTHQLSHGYLSAVGLVVG